MIADHAARLRALVADLFDGRAPTRENDDGRRGGPRDWIEGANTNGREFPRSRGRELLAWGPFLWTPHPRSPTPQLGAALCLGEMLANPHDRKPRWEPSLFCFAERSYDDVRIDLDTLAVEADGLHGDTSPGRHAVRGCLVRPLDHASAEALGAPRGTELETWARHKLSLDPPDPTVALGDDADEKLLPRLVAQLDCAKCGRKAFEIEVVPPFANPSGWSEWDEVARSDFDRRRWPRNYWMTMMGPGGGTGGMVIGRERAKAALEAFDGSYSFRRIRAGGWLPSAGVCLTCRLPYCSTHWNTSDSGGGRCPEGHAQVVDPLGRSMFAP
jgi:hypothetical protein